MAMHRRRLGTGGLEVSALGLGCMGMSQAYGPGDDAESIATVERSIDLGMDFIDTSDVYGVGHNEELLGKALAGRRDEVVLATKFGVFRHPDGGSGFNGRPEYVAKACDASLGRLGIEVIDLYYLHRLDRDTPIEDTVGAMGRLVEAGKVRFIGLSEVGAATLRRAHSVHPIAALQTEYSLWTRLVETEILPTCRELGIGFVSYSPLGRGFLTATVTTTEGLDGSDRRHLHPRFQGDNLRSNLALLGALRDMAAAKGCTPAQLALAWVLARGDDIVPIPGTKRRRFLEENADAVDVALDAADMEALDATFPPGITAGDRYPAEQMVPLEI